MENDYLSTIETEYSRIRGKLSLLTPKDWSLAQSWEDSGIPLRIVIRAMQEVKKNFDKERRPDKINSLSYFTQAVKKHFADWSKGQAGKPKEETKEMRLPQRKWNQDRIPDPIELLQEEVQTLENMKRAYSNRYADKTLPEPIQSNLPSLIESLDNLITQTKTGKLNINQIEESLESEQIQLEISMVSALSDQQRSEIIQNINKELENLEMSDEAKRNFTNKKLYTKFNLPELTLFTI